MTTFSVQPGLFPVEHRFLDLGGTRIHYVDGGASETLLLLHGNPSRSLMYRKIITALRDAFRCVALDYPGYGMSEAQPGYGFTPREHSAVLEQFVDRLGLKGLTMMVQDWGGPIGLGFAGRRPELLKRLIGNTFAWPLDKDFRIRLFSWLMGGPVGRSLTFAFNFVPKYFFATRVGPEGLTRSSRKCIWPRGANALGARQLRLPRGNLSEPLPTFEKSKAIYESYAIGRL